MAYKTCENCGSRIFEHGCVNCDEMEYISMQKEYEPVSSRLDAQVTPKIAEVEEILKFIKQFQDEQSSSLRQTYDGFNITKNNIELLQKLRRKIKSNFSA